MLLYEKMVGKVKYRSLRDSEIIASVCIMIHLRNRETFLFDYMKRIYNKVFKSKKPSLGSIQGPGGATSTSTFNDLMSSIPASDATASAQVTAGVSVSVQPIASLSIDLLLSSSLRPLIVS